MRGIVSPKKIESKISLKKREEAKMIEISENIYIGGSSVYEENKNKEDMNFINACKYPYWVEYSNKRCTNGLYGYDKNRLICNLVDANDINYIPKEIIEECIEFIEKSIRDGKKILINCNQGVSRSATIGLIYLIKNDKISGENFKEIIENYKKIVPRYNPNFGMLNYAKNYYLKLYNENNG